MSSKLRTTIIAAVWVLAAACAFGQTDGFQPRGNTISPTPAQAGKGSISGRVSDAAGGVLQGASVKIQPGGFSAVSDGEGQFAITNLPAGSYTVTISYSGFSLFTRTVSLDGGQTISVEAVMQVASANQAINVHADLQGEAEEIQVQRTSENIVNVIDADVITSLPNANIADAVGRLPGVSLERDEGEGKYVQIRGTEPRLTNVTIDGINVPSPEATVRQVKLDVIPADLVDSIELNKTLTASQDGDAIGGTVDLKLKSAGDQPTLILETIAGYTPILGGRYVGTADSTVGQRFGADKRIGVLFGYTYDYNGRGIDDIEPGLDTGGFPTPFYDSLDLREYRYQRTRWGLGGTVDYRLKENSSIYVHYLYSRFNDYGNKWVYTLNDGGLPEFTTSQRTPSFNIGMISAGAKHLFTNSWLAWDVSVADSGQLQAAGNPGVTFDPITDPSNFNCTFDPAATIHPYLPKFNAACTAKGSATFDPTQYAMTEFDTSTGVTGQVNLQGSVSWGKNYNWGSHRGTFEVGAKLRNAHKYQNANSPVWDPNGTFLMSDFLSGFKANDYYSGSYNFGPVTSFSKLKSFFNHNPGDFTEDVSDTHLGSDPNNYNLTERVTAGYIVNNLQFGRFRLQTGLRLEATQLSIQGFKVLTIPSGPNAGDWLSTTPEVAKQWYIDPLPSVQLRYNLTANSDIRAVYGRGLSRPDPFDLVPFSIVDQSTNPFTVQIGNPNLKPEHANDYDVLYEHYLQPYGVIQAGFFYKQLTDPIYSTSSLPAASGPFQGLFVQQNINGSNANVRGVELAYLQHFDFLPGPLRGLGLTANYTYTASNAGGLPGRTDRPALQRQAPNTFNIIPSYDRGRVSIHVGMSYNSAMIYQYQFINEVAGVPTPPLGGTKGPSGDIYLYPHFQVDAQGTVRLIHGLTMVLEGENLNNEVFGFYTGSKIFVDQREFYRPTYSLGLRWYPLRRD